MKKLERKHALAIRWLHWLNFPLLTVMIWSGLLIYWSNSVYSIRVGGYTLFKFFPQGFYEALDMESALHPQTLLCQGYDWYSGH